MNAIVPSRIAAAIVAVAILVTGSLAPAATITWPV